MHNFRLKKNLKFKHLIDIVATDLWSSYNFVSMEYVIRTCNPTVRFSKFISNKKIYKKFKGFLSKLIWWETFSQVSSKLICRETPKTLLISFYWMWILKI